jgi:hypothetical protein
MGAALHAGMSARAAIGRAMRNKICKRIFLPDQARQFGKRVFGTAHARACGLLRLREPVGARCPKSAVVGH